MTARRALVIALAIPYCLVMFPIWFARDIAGAVCDGYREGRRRRQLGHRREK